MLFWYELKKIFKRITPLIMVMFIIAVATTTIIITSFVFNKSEPEPDYSEAYVALQDKINYWHHDERDTILSSFDLFHQEYKNLTTLTYTYCTNAEIESAYANTKEKFEDFYDNQYRAVIYNGTQNKISDYLLVRGDQITNLDDTLKRLKVFFTGTKDADTIITGLTINLEWDRATMDNMLDNVFVQKIEPEDLEELQSILLKGFRTNDDYIYTQGKYTLAVAKASNYKGHLSEYAGFEDYKNAFDTTAQIELASYRRNHPEQIYADAFTFGNIYNNMSQVSLFDFMFTNLEMATIPFLVLVMILAACVFFTDNYRNTVITTLAAEPNRTLVIFNKVGAVLLTAIVNLLFLCGIYLASALLFFHATITPDILCLFNGQTPLVINATGYFLMYLLNIIFKILPFIAISGLFSFAKTDPRIIIGITVLTIAAIIVCNALLGYFSFYQYVPLLALDPIRYFGAKLFLSPTPPIYNIWYTLPILSLVIIYLYWQLIHNFKRKDF